VADLPPIMREHTDPPRNHIEDQRLEVVGGWATYSPVMEGQGRWVLIEAPAGLPVGTVWTDDRDGLGFLPVPLNEHGGAPAFAAQFRADLLDAWAAGITAATIFDWWAGRASVALAAGQVETGDLTDLASRLA